MSMPCLAVSRRLLLSACAVGALVAGCALQPPAPADGRAATPPKADPAPRAAPPAPRPAAPEIPPPAPPPPPDPAHNVFFPTGSHKVSAEGKRMLQAVAEKLKGKVRADVTLVGHTDDAGSAEFNVALAQRRVEAVAAELESLGVSPRQIRRISYGDEAGGPTCATAACRQQKRRVEMRVSEN